MSVPVTPPATAPVIAPGTYAYAAALNGARIGNSTIVVKHSGTTTEIDENSSGSFNGTAGTANATLDLGADLSPISYQNKFAAGAIGGTASVAFSNTSANLTSPMGNQSFTLAGDAKHFTVIDGAELAGFIALPAEMRAWNGGPATAIVPVYGVAVSIVADGAQPARPQNVPATDVAISINGQIPFTVWYNPTTYIADQIDVPSQNIIVTRVNS